MVALITILFVPRARAADAPTVTPVSPINESLVGQVRPTISFTLSTDAVEDSVACFIDTIKVTATPDAEGLWSAAPTWDLANGPHTVSVILIGNNAEPGGLKWTFN